MMVQQQYDNISGQTVRSHYGRDKLLSGLVVFNLKQMEPAETLNWTDIGGQAKVAEQSCTSRYHPQLHALLGQKLKNWDADIGDRFFDRFWTKP